MSPRPDTSNVRLPEIPALIAGPGGALFLSLDGEITEIALADAPARLDGIAPLVCHRRSVARWLNAGQFPAYDILELFAFVRPAQFCVPTVRGVADALGLDRPQSPDKEAAALFTAANRLLSELSRAKSPAKEIAAAMTQAGWSWGQAVLAALNGDGPKEAPESTTRATGMRIWNRLSEWSEHAPTPPPSHVAVESQETADRLSQLLGTSAEHRPEQIEYSDFVRTSFAPAEDAAEPHVVVAEAGTGIGKTVGYLAPATLWAQKNTGAVWISTFTRNLQRQLDGELDRVYPDSTEKSLKAVVRKGRENYLCLLNYEEAVGQLALRREDAVALGLVARWALATRDGDMIGGDFPAWLGDLLGQAQTVGLTDTRGECIYAACSHYGKCFIERSIRRARRAEVVVANHALVMTQAALGGGDDAYLPTRYVFDEGHHLLDAADSAFSAFLSGREMSELRRWLLGAEGRRRARARGLQDRIGDLIADDEEEVEAVMAVLKAAHLLPNQGWLERLAAGNPVAAAEQFLVLVRQQVYARDRDPGLSYDMETEVTPPISGLIEAATELHQGLGGLLAPLQQLIKRLLVKLDAEADQLDTATRQRIEGLARSLERRARLPLENWRAMLSALDGDTPPDFVDWFAVERIAGHDFDLGMHRNWIDPTVPFTEQVVRPSHGVLMTSATLRDVTKDDDADWRSADIRTGAHNLVRPAERAAFPSPFDYGAMTRVLVVTDVDKNDAAQVAAAYRELMRASGGGAIGLFTSIARLRGVYDRLVAAGLMDEMLLLAQHVDPLDTGTLVDIFRAEEDACLLGTDAVRDGVDVPGRSLRMLIYDRVPWPRPTILHKARKTAYGAGYDDMLTRLKIKQAFGRLIRGAKDRGVFVLLDRALPSRLHSAFPDGVTVERIGLADAVSDAGEFLTNLEAAAPIRS